MDLYLVILYYVNPESYTSTLFTKDESMIFQTLLFTVNH